MATRIRLARAGSKKRPYYRIVIADVRSPRDGRFIERVGSYNPLLAKDSAERVVLNVERIEHWLKEGAKPTDRVLRFLDGAGLAKRPARNNPNKAKPGQKAQERVEEKTAAAADKAEAAKVAEEEAKAAAEAPVEEAPVEAPVEEAPVEAPAEEAPVEAPAEVVAEEETKAE